MKTVFFIALGTIVTLHGSIAQVPPTDYHSLNESHDVVQVPPQREIVSSLFSNDGKTIATIQNEGSKLGTMELWDAQKGTLLWTCDTPVKYVFAFSPDGRILAGVNTNGGIVCWNAETGGVRQSFSLRGHLVFAMAFSPDGTILATGGSGTFEKGGEYIIQGGIALNNHGEVNLWDAQTGRLLRTLRGHEGVVGDVCFSADGKLVASAGEDKVVKIWNCESGELLQTLKPGKNTWIISSVAFVPDGHLLAVGRGVIDHKSQQTKGDITLWNVQTGELQLTLSEPDPEVVLQISDRPTIAFSPDGKVLASAGTDETVLLWDVQTGIKCGGLMAHSPSRTGKYSMRFVSEGLKLGSHTDDGRIQITLLSTEQPK